jgi:hypothetical protein
LQLSLSTGASGWESVESSCLWHGEWDASSSGKEVDDAGSPSGPISGLEVPHRGSFGR